MAGMISRPMACRAQPVVAAWTKNTLQDHFFKEAKKQGEALYYCSHQAAWPAAGQDLPAAHLCMQAKACLRE